MKMSLRPPSFAAIRTQLRRARRAKLRTRVLLGVLGVTLVALVAFDVAAVTALRGYLMNQTDSQLRAVLAEYRVTTFPDWPPQILPASRRGRSWSGSGTARR